jgi:hypothetical protein
MAYTGRHTENAQNTEERRLGSLHGNTMNRELQILQVNMRKSREAQHALHNDEALADFHFILG